jgi:uncharacterized protein
LPGSETRQMRIWVDVLTPKQALFTKEMLARAPRKIELVITSRDYSELNRFLSQIKMEHKSFGRHGGPTVQGKLVASIDRMHALVPYVTSLRPDSSISFISPEAARVSFGLGLPHFICSDSPHAVAPCKLAIPLSRSVFTPFVIKKSRWTHYGINGTQVLNYHALDPWAWLLTKKKERVNNAGQNVVLIRLEESYASYVKSGMGISEVLDRLVRVIRSKGDFEIVIIPRYDDQREWARKKFGKACVVPSGTVDGTDMISKASLLVGGGGTMTQEAALLGTPNISYFPSSHLDVFENYYFPKRLSVRATRPEALIRETLRVLSNIEKERNEFKERARKAVSSFEDPVEFVFKQVLEKAQK